MSEASANVQWKGTDACMDVYCPCGRRSHFDGMFAYFVRCACGKVWQVPTALVLTEADADDSPLVELVESVDPRKAAST